MAPSRRSVHGTGSSARRPARDLVIVEDIATITSSDDEQEPDVAHVRQAREEYYGKTPAERDAQRSMPRRRVEGDRARRGTTGGASVQYVVGSGRGSTVEHRRRRKTRPRDDEIDERGGTLVYRSTTTTTTVPKRSSSGAQRTASRLSLGLPQRHTSQRSTRVVTDDVQRRHSHHGEVRPRRVTSRASRQDLRTNDALPKRSISLREDPRPSAARDSLTRSQTTKTRRSRVTPPALQTVPEDTKVQAAPRGRTTTVWSLFGPSRGAAAAPEPRVACLTCMDDFPASRTAKLECGHRMCKGCLKRLFTMSVTDPAHMPPRCCTSDCIPLKHVERLKLFDMRFKMRWNRKYQEYTTANRLYCPSRGCGAWIPPKDIRPDPRNPTRRYGRCARCRTKVCAACNNKWHTARECPNDEATQRFVEMAKEQGWQRCYNCKATVELKEGCNHMTCRCTAQFCMICGAKWKTCNCPWFNYGALDGDEEWAPRAPPYHEEVARRREQEHRDENLARRMQGLDLDRHLTAVRTRHVRADPPVDDGLAYGDDHAWAQELDFARPPTVHESLMHRAAALLSSPVTRERAAAADQLIAELRRSEQPSGRGSGGSPTDAAARRRSSPAEPIHTAEVPVRIVSRGRTSERAGRRRPPPPPAAGDRARSPAAQSAEEVVVVKRVRTKDSSTSKPTRSKESSSGTGTGTGTGSRRSKGKARASTTKPSRARDQPEEAADEETVPAAKLAGLSRKSTQGRVDAWRRHVGAGLAACDA